MNKCESCTEEETMVNGYCTNSDCEKYYLAAPILTRTVWQVIVKLLDTKTGLLEFCSSQWLSSFGDVAQYVGEKERHARESGLRQHVFEIHETLVNKRFSSIAEADLLDLLNRNLL